MEDHDFDFNAPHLDLPLRAGFGSDSARRKAASVALMPDTRDVQKDLDVRSAAPIETPSGFPDSVYAVDIVKSPKSRWSSTFSTLPSRDLVSMNNVGPSDIDQVSNMTSVSAPEVAASHGTGMSDRPLPPP